MTIREWKFTPNASDVIQALRVAGAGNINAPEFGFNGDGTIDKDTVNAFLGPAAKLASEVWAPTNQIGHEYGATNADLKLNPDTGYNEVEFPEGYAPLLAALKAYEADGWNAPTAPEKFGGMDMPWSLNMAITEQFNAANMGLALKSLLTQGAIEAIQEYGSDDLKTKYLQKLVTGTYSATMLLTEGKAGSDLAQLTTKATALPDGSYAIKGEKIFITWGDHETSENIIHLVLARTQDVPGIKGISLFVVPKHMTDDDGNILGRNGVECTSLLEKAGIHASPTCIMEMGGDKGDAIGYLIGEEFLGMRYMFVMMNRARLMVGLQGVALAERSFQAAVQFAQERTQGQNVETGEKNTAIINHPDIRRRLAVARAQILASRMLCNSAAVQLDLSKVEVAEGDKEGEEAKAKAQRMLELLTPVVKAGCTDMGQDVTSSMLQVAGGTGFIKETGFEQFVSDSIIPPIYEGTNGIQAMDLLARKLGMGAELGALVYEWIADMRAELQAHNNIRDQIYKESIEALDVLEDVTKNMIDRGLLTVENFASATDYLKMFYAVAGGTMMARSFTITREIGGEERYRDARNMAEIYRTHILPNVAVCKERVLEGSKHILEAHLPGVVYNKS